MTTLFERVLIFDGTGAGLSGPSAVLVKGNKIAKVALNGTLKDSAEAAGALVIDGMGTKVLMPGLSDAHYHLNFAALDVPTVLNPQNEIDGAFCSYLDSSA